MNTTDSTFEADVFQRSTSELVLVDFWAEWCHPCRMLAPILEKVVESFQGKVALVKAHTEANQKAANEFRVSGIPAVFAILDGQVIDSFEGLMPEQAIRSWISGLMKSVDLMEAKKIRATDPVAAESKVRGIVEKNPNYNAGWIFLAELYLELGRDDECQGVIQQMEAQGFLEPPAERIKAELDLKKRSGLDLGALRVAAEDPNNLDAQFALAEGLAAKHEFREACEICLNLLLLDRNRTGEKAKTLMLEIFRVLPEDSSLTLEYRRKLSLVLY